MSLANAWAGTERERERERANERARGREGGREGEKGEKGREREREIHQTSHPFLTTEPSGILILDLDLRAALAPVPAMLAVT